VPEAQSKDLKIDYTDAGQGEPALLLMSGWCATREAYGTMPDLCAKHRRVLALDWRGHGRSTAPTTDFGNDGLVEDALAVIQASGAQSVIPVALAHSGWVAIELRRRLGPRIPKLVLIEWLVLDAPLPFLSALRGLQDKLHWEETRNGLFAGWLKGTQNEALSQFVQSMGLFGFEMWSRSGREISAAYTRYGNPLRALEKLQPPLPVLHLYAQPADPVVYQAQQAFAERNAWFQVKRVNAISHFPMLEIPEDLAEAIENFAVGNEAGASAR
jgi:pimeloyl-ACP methyl ester carboxylesterase